MSSKDIRHPNKTPTHLEMDATNLNAKTKRGKAFWLVFLALAVSLYQAAFELCAVGIGLPSIAGDLDAVDFVWVGSAYAIAASCALPMTGGMAQTFGRRAAMMTSLLIFAVGSALCGASQSMNMLVAGRVVQGWGGGGILSMPQIILADLIPLRERGTYNGILGVTWSIAIVTSSAIAGALADAGQWRWIFYINLPITGFASLLVWRYLTMSVPSGSIGSKLKKMDSVGNFLVIGATCSGCIALTWAGVKYPWDSPQVLVPLCVSGVAFTSFVAYELKAATNPLVPFHLLTGGTCIAGFLTSFLSSLITMTGVYYLPVYLQACKGQSAAHAGGIGWLGFSLTVGPWGIVAGASVVLFKRFVPTLLSGWILVIIGVGLWSTLNIDSSAATIGGFEAVFGLGIGTLYAAAFFPVLAPLPIKSHARALAFFNFLRAFGQVWGITVGASVLQNQLLKKLPLQFVSRLPHGVQVAYTAIPAIEQLEEPLRSRVREAFAESLHELWIVVLGLTAFGTACTFAFIREVPMHNYTDDDWVLTDPDPDPENRDLGLSRVEMRRTNSDENTRNDDVTQTRARP